MTQSTRSRERAGDEGGRKAAPAGVLGALGGAAAALRSRWKLLLPLWLTISAVLIALILLLPGGYEQTFALSISTIQTDLQANVGQQAPDPTQAGNQAVNFLEQTDFGHVTLSPTFDPANQRIQVRAKSQDREALEKVPSKAVASVKYGFQATYEGSLGSSIRTQIASSRQRVGGARAALRDIEARIADTKPEGPEDVEGIAKLTVLESKRQDALYNIASERERIKSLQGDLKDLPRLAARPVSVDVANASDVRQGRSRVPAAIFAVLLGFVAAAAVVLRFAAARGK